MLLRWFRDELSRSTSPRSRHRSGVRVMVGLDGLWRARTLPPRSTWRTIEWLVHHAGPAARPYTLQQPAEKNLCVWETGTTSSGVIVRATLNKTQPEPKSSGSRYGGEGEIRTHGTLIRRPPEFSSRPAPLRCALTTSPVGLMAYARSTPRMRRSIPPSAAAPRSSRRSNRPSSIGGLFFEHTLRDFEVMVRLPLIAYVECAAVRVVLGIARPERGA